MARRRRYSRKHMRKANPIGKLIMPSTFLVSFLQQATQKDISASTTFNGLTGINKAQFVLVSAFQHLTGFNANSALVPNKPFALNPSGMVNKWVGLGILGYLYSKAPIGLPAKGVARKAAMGLIAGGLLGGIIDDPVRQGGGTSPTNFGMGQYSPANVTNQLYGIDGAAGVYVG